MNERSLVLSTGRASKLENYASKGKEKHLLAYSKLSPCNPSPELRALTLSVPARAHRLARFGGAALCLLLLASSTDSFISLLSGRLTTEKALFTPLSVSCC
ncbi:hypothetical protein BaRGS_00020457 [Batillaria attramentaria]|uniref:Uncharacterized protein n=1 Tax=Batillaria attramentaria TaxID=370345 RepID=A0ABD0KMN5_9CAEN